MIQLGLLSVASVYGLKDGIAVSTPLVAAALSAVWVNLNP
jgi:hypothetical protein